MPSTLLTCPDETELLALAMGEPLDPVIGAHVDQCASCQANRDRLQAEVALLRQNHGPATTPSSPEHDPAGEENENIDDPLLQLMERLRTENQFDVIKAVRFVYRGE